MHWALTFLASLASGVFSILASLVVLVVVLHLCAGYMFGTGAHEAVGWDPVSRFGSHWKAAVVGIPAVVFAFGFSAAFWLFSKRQHG